MDEILDKMIKEQEKGQEESDRSLELLRNIFDEEIKQNDKFTKQLQVETEITISRLKELKVGPTIRDNVKELYDVVGRLIDVMGLLGEAFTRLHDRQNELAAKLWLLKKKV